MVNEESFPDLMERLRKGEDHASIEIFRRYANRLIGLARNHIDAKLRSKLDPEDVLQSAWKSFFLRYQDGQYDLAGWDNLWNLLTTITIRKCRRWKVKFQTDKRKIDLEFPKNESNDQNHHWEAMGKEPTPDEAILMADTVQGLMEWLPENHREILSMALKGFKVADISQELDVSERTVQRTLERVRERLETLIQLA